MASDGNVAEAGGIVGAVGDVGAVPALADKSQDEATKMLQAAGLTVTVQERRAPGLRDGFVVAQDPPPGKQVCGYSHSQRFYSSGNVTIAAGGTLALVTDFAKYASTPPPA